MEFTLNRIFDSIENHLPNTEKAFQFSKKCVYLQTDSSTPRSHLDSSLGGVPYWTAEAGEFPRNEAGEPLLLLAQINLRQVNDIKEISWDWPISGMLQYFIDSSDDAGNSYWCDFEEPCNQKGFRIVYHEQIDENAPVFAPILDFEYGDMSPLTNSAEWRRISFVLGESYPEVGSLECDALESADSLPEDYDERDIPAGHKLWGFPNFTQSDPRTSEEYELLFQLDTDENVMFGDTGIANFFIKPEDLRQRDFSRVWYNWDCC